MFAYAVAQLVALMTSIEGVMTKSALNHFSTQDHLYYKHLSLFFFSFLFGIWFWDIHVYGWLFVGYAVVISFLNEQFRSKAIQSLELNVFALLSSLSVFLIYLIEWMIGREELMLKNLFGLFLFTGAFYLFLEVKVKDFLTINKQALLYTAGIILIASLDRPIAKSMFDQGWVNPATFIWMRSFVLLAVFYYLARKHGLIGSPSQSEGIRVHTVIAFLKYARELLYSYALVWGSVLIVTLALNTALFITFLISGFYFKESKWTLKKGIAVVIACLSIVMISL